MQADRQTIAVLSRNSGGTVHGPWIRGWLKLRLWVMLAGLVAVSGCSMCAPGFIDDYATVGGKWQRSDPTTGRVGSIFSDTGTLAGHSSAAGAVYGDGQPTEVYQEDVYHDDFGGEVYEGTVYGHDFHGDASEGSIELVPQYEDGSIILGEGW